ncbi:TPA: CRISPR-associated helicase/endonuclease Cas3, partial [Escherichia coli]|nr:CRISPR-associated helicase/endonuclease Cas3 [Escherichia coli]HAL9563304.1 CRISPR-associated helicase/endonuclease Cas3 [Escherichia coli]
FDWLITQHCPADLLFQRLGRLHRHHRKYRPAGFEIPVATILLPDGEGYGRHEHIYSNVRVMWRTQQHIEELNGASLFFPDAYRQWLDSIYDDAEMDEPEWVIKGMDKFESAECEKRFKARKVLQWAEEYSLQDNDETILAVTRDGEMSLPLLPYVQTSSGKQLLDGQVYEDLSYEQQYEALALNRVNVPFTWKRSFSEVVDEDGLLWLEGKQNQDGWFWQGNSIVITYTRDEGMTRVIPANPK